ncbi:MAG: hypothetical protein DMF54_05460 [Acidobacteria bacterium]|nr:MAG: hypothetical protein DMF55_08255 [Acidobacteriota bacterium]PYQ67140.1 MAG: hypothetical protein DMF54_05460 [Acidobacteriota bacterium]
MNLGKARPVRSLHVLPAVVAFATLFPTAVARPAVPPRPSSAFSESDRQALASWTMAQPEVRSAVARHRTRILRVWSDAVKGEPVGLGAVLLRDYDTGLAREITVDLASGRITMRELPGIQPSEEEIEEGMAIVRHDPALLRFVENPGLRLIGGFHNRSAVRDDPCAIEVCLEFAFMKPNYEGPARYVVVNLTRRAVAHHDFRVGSPGGPPARMTETGDR